MINLPCALRVVVNVIYVHVKLQEVPLQVSVVTLCLTSFSLVSRRGRERSSLAWGEGGLSARVQTSVFSGSFIARLSYFGFASGSNHLRENAEHFGAFQCADEAVFFEGVDDGYVALFTREHHGQNIQQPL